MLYGTHQGASRAFFRAHGGQRRAGGQHQDQCNSDAADRLHDAWTVAPAFGSGKPWRLYIFREAARLEYRLAHCIFDMIPWLSEQQTFPPVRLALQEPNGLLAAGGDLSAPRLLQAYRHGVFPWFSAGQPILWWSPDPRMVLLPHELHVSRSLTKRLKQQDYEIRCDTAFREVMLACADVPRPGQDGTWITDEMIAAYCRLHALGHAHSVEVWMQDRLVGGIYGVAIGKVFYAESMFHRVTDASKIALVHLVWKLRDTGFGLIDCQMKTAHLASMGAREISRDEFIAWLARLIEPWQE